MFAFISNIQWYVSKTRCSCVGSCFAALMMLLSAGLETKYGERIPQVKYDERVMLPCSLVLWLIVVISLL